MNAGDICLLAKKIKGSISEVIVGKEDIIEKVIISMFCAGHVLLEDVPGVGKTMLAKCLSRSIDCDFKRIQFTPDLLPSDLTGINYFNQKQSEFVLRKGPLFTHIVLADEINRATPRTQSSLLECMEERQVTIDGVTYPLETPFFVIATQNPVETQGTFPLPEAQMDRFFMRLQMGYPNAAEGKSILDRFQSGTPFPGLRAVASTGEIEKAQEGCLKIKVSDAVKEYIIHIVEATRKHEGISLGVSPRGSIALMKAAQAHAAVAGREFATPDDVKSMAVPVLSHRIMLKGHAISRGTSNAEAVMAGILKSVAAPVEEIG